jgi:membrane protein implicated in regulation of membrane protease activity
MEWFLVWWNDLGLVGQIMACAAIPMTVVMFLQLILMIMGVGFSGEADVDINEEAIDTTAETTPPDSKGNGSSSTFKIFTIRGIVAFFALGGWAGLAALAAGLHPFWAIQISLFAGLCALMLAAIIIRLALRMQTSGNLNINHAVAQTGEVYIRVPAGRSDKGKVTLLMQERFVELDAITDSDTDILPESKVEIISIADGDTLVVRPIK